MTCLRRNFCPSTGQVEGDDPELVGLVEGELAGGAVGLPFVAAERRLEVADEGDGGGLGVGNGRWINGR